MNLIRSRRLLGAATITILSTAVVALPAGPASATGFDITSVERASGTVGPDITGRKSAWVDCPGVKKVVGTGWSTNPSNNQILIEDVIPFNDSVQVTARVDPDGYVDAEGDPIAWSLTAWAVCADAPAGLQIVDDGYTGVSSDSPKDISSDCPADKVVLGTGFQQSDQQGYSMLNGVVPEADSVRAIASEDTATTVGWSLKAIAICAYEVDQLELVSSSNQTAYPRTVENSVCDSGDVTLGGGMEIFDGAADVSVQTLKPTAYGGSEFVTATAVEDASATDDWDATTWSVCVPFHP